MKHPALMRTLGIFLALVSLLTLFAAGLGFRKLGLDRQERLRQEELTAARIEEAEQVFARLAALQDDYDAIMQDYPSRKEAEEKDSAAYRMALGTHTATRAGLVLGRNQLDAAAAALKEGIRMYYIGLEAFEKGEAAFLPIYDAYLRIRKALDSGISAAGDLRAASAQNGEGLAVFSPEEVLALSSSVRDQYAALDQLLTDYQTSLPTDQRQAESYLRSAAQHYNEYAPMLSDFNVEQLAYQAGTELYARADSAMAAAIDAGADAEEAKQAADDVCQQSFGMSYAELGEWLSANEPAEETSISLDTLSPEMLDLALGALPNDRELVAGALSLLAEQERSLAEKEAAFRSDPADMNAAELLIAALEEALASADRLLSLIGPTIEEVKAQMDAGRAQMNLALGTIGAGQKSIKEGYDQLDEKAEELEQEKADLLAKRQTLDAEQTELRALSATVDDYQTLFDRARSMRAVLLSYDGVSGANTDELLRSAKDSLADDKTAGEHTEALRRVNCAVLLAAALFGLVSAFGAFEKPRIRRLWLPLFAALLLGAGGEAISLYLGRGLWYSALFLPIFSAVMLPLSLPAKKSADT